MNEIYYSIKELATLSGIKAHTIRIWEERYKLLNPKRTETNIRLYSSDDLKKLLNISLLYSNGEKISKIAQLSNSQIIEKVNKLKEKEYDDSHQIEELIVSMIELDEVRFEKAFNASVLKIGLYYTVLDVLFSFLRKVGVMWQTGSIMPAQEHFISNIIRQKIIVAIDGQLVRKSEKQKRVLLFLPEGELHEISLLFYSYILRSKGFDVIYFGQSVPFNDVVETLKITPVNALLTIITQPLKKIKLDTYLNSLSQKFKTKKILISGAQIIGIDLPKHKNIIPFTSPQELIKIVENFD